MTVPVRPTDEEIADFRRDGHVTLRGLVEPGLAESWRETVEDVLEALPDRRPPAEQRRLIQRAFRQEFNLWEHDERARALVFSPQLATAAARLLGCRAVRLYHDQALFKEPGGAATPWHADAAYWPVEDGHRTITAWIPLQPIPREMGPLSFAAGSQQLGEGVRLTISDTSERELGETLAREGVTVVEEPFELGDVSFHEGWVLHRAPANTTSEPRRVMTVIYLDAELRVAAPVTPAQEHDLAAWLGGAAPGTLPSEGSNPLVPASATASPTRG